MSNNVTFAARERVRSRSRAIFSGASLAIMSAGVLVPVAMHSAPAFARVTAYERCVDWGYVAYNGRCVEVFYGQYLYDSLDRGGGTAGYGGRGGGRNPPIKEPIPVVIAGVVANPDPCNQSGNPIVLSTGNKIEPEVDFSTSGELALHLQRTYNHYWSGVGLFGRHWTSSFDYKLTFGSTNVDACYPRPGGGACGIGSNTTIYAWRPDGGTIKFVRAADGKFYEDKPDPLARIEVQSDGSFALYDYHGGFELYSSAGYIERVQNASNTAWNFSYTNGTYLQRVTHTTGRYVEFTWTSGQLTAVRDPAGSYYGFSYSANALGTGLHRLAASSQPGTPTSTTTYHYELTGDKTALTGKSYNGVRYSTFTYDASGRATGSAHNGEESHTFTYTAGPNGALSVVETNPLGKQSTHEFVNGKPTSVTGHASTYCPATYALTEYDTNGYPAMVSDFNDNKTAYVHNAKGQLLTKVEGYGTPEARTYTYEWWGADKNNYLKSITVGGLVRVSYDYSGARVTSITTTNLSTYGVANQSRTTTYSTQGTCFPGYCLIGVISAVTEDGPLSGTGDALTSNFDTSGNLISSVNGLGQQTTYSNHNGLGQPGRVTGVNGSITDYTYDARGRKLSETKIISGVSYTTSFTYDARGRIVSTTQPDGVITKASYDVQDRVGTISRTRPYEDGNIDTFDETVTDKLVYSYNANSNVTQQLNQSNYQGKIMDDTSGRPRPIPFSSTVTQRQAFVDYDELGRPRADRGNNGQNTRYTYDGNGNITSITDGLNRVTSFTYDSLGRLITATNALNGVTRYEYDKADRVTKVTDPRGLITASAYDGFGRMWAESSPDTGTTTYAYHADGKLATVTRQNGVSTTYGYDQAGRVTSVTAGGQSTTYGYDWCGNGVSMLCNANSPDSIIHYGYTPEGQVAVRRELTTANGVQSDYWTYFYYDGLGRTKAVTYPDGSAVGYGYADGVLKAMTLNVGGNVTNLVTGAEYRAFGPATSWSYGNGLFRYHAYDEGYAPGDQRPTSVKTMNGVTALQDLRMQYRSTDSVSKITNVVSPNLTQDFTYDALERLTGVAAPAINQTFQYDANGNKVQHNWTWNESVTVEPASNRVVAMTSHGYTNDVVGNRRTHSWSGSTATYGYNSANQMTSVSRNSALVAAEPNNTTINLPAGTSNYQYNAYGERVWKSAPSVGSYRYVYGLGNRLMAEYKDGSGWTNYLWFQDQLIGLTRSGQTYFIHVDQLGRPEIVTNSGKAVVWRAENYPYDRKVTLDSIGGLDVGLPGQYYDRESNLWYNINRYYDARLGRYTQSDPIGLMGGTNTYAYVGADPVNLVDPLGLAAAEGVMADCLKQIFGQSVAGVNVRNKQFVDNEWITTRKNSIRLPPDYSSTEFFSNPHLVLHEYYHVLKQWNTGDMTRRSYAAEFLRNGAEKGNKYEDAADAFADANIAAMQNCLQGAMSCTP